MLSLVVASSDFTEAVRGGSFVVMSVNPLDNGQDISIASSNIDFDAFFNLVDNDFLRDEVKMKRLFFAITGFDGNAYGSRFIFECSEDESPVVKVGVELKCDGTDPDYQGELNQDDNGNPYLLLTHVTNYRDLPDDWEGDDVSDLYRYIEPPKSVARVLSAFPELQLTINGKPVNQVNGKLGIQETFIFKNGNFSPEGFPLEGYARDIFKGPLAASVATHSKNGLPSIHFHVATISGGQLTLSENDTPQSPATLSSILHGHPYFLSPPQNQKA